MASRICVTSGMQTSVSRPTRAYKIDGGSSLQRSEKRNQVPEFLSRELTVQPLRHDRNTARFERLNLGPGDSHFGPVRRDQVNGVGGLAADHSGMAFTILQMHDKRFVPANEAVAGEDDGFQQIGLGAN